MCVHVQTYRHMCRCQRRMSGISYYYKSCPPAKGNWSWLGFCFSCFIQAPTIPVPSKLQENSCLLVSWLRYGHVHPRMIFFLFWNHNYVISLLPFLPSNPPYTLPSFISNSCSHFWFSLKIYVYVYVVRNIICSEWIKCHLYLRF